MIPGVTGKRRGGGIVTYVGGVPGDGGHTSWAAPVTASWVIGSAIPAAAAGDLGLLAITADRDGVFAPGAPSGWSLYFNYGPTGQDKRLSIFGKFLTAGDLTGTTALGSWQGQHDYSMFLALFRGVDTVTPIYDWDIAQGGAEKGTDVARAGSMLIEYFCDWGDSVPAQAAPAGAVRQYYSPNVRWEASLGLYTKANMSPGTALKIGMATGQGDRFRYEATLQPAA